MAFKFKRTIPAPAQAQIPVSLTAREWEVVRKAIRGQAPDFRDPSVSDLRP